MGSQRVLLALALIVLAPIAAAEQLPEDSMQTAPFDLFPLKSGLHCKYIYDHRYSAGSLGQGYVHFTTDSGSVEYFVHDSAGSGDSAISWSIEQRRLLFHWIHYPGEQDTTYWTDDTLFFTLTEGTSFNHELTSESLIWRFPFQNADTTIAVFRYSDTASVVIAATWKGPPWEDRGGGDSLVFLESLGLVEKESFSINKSPTNASYGTTRITLEKDPSLRVHEPESLPGKFALLQNYPNPFNPTTGIRYQVSGSGWVHLAVYDVLGREVAVLVNDRKAPGGYEVRFNARQAGAQTSGLASGVYFYRLQAGNFVDTKKLLLLR